MDKKPLITFIIPTINRPTLDRTIKSVLKQTYSNWRCVVIFDGVDKIDFKDSRITSLSIPKTGLVGPKNGQSGLVRNEGIKISNSEWIGFLDDDDTLNEKYVETLVKNYLKYDFVVWRMKYRNGLVLPPQNLNELQFARVGISFCYKNKFDNLLFESNRDGEDFDFLKKLESLTKNFVIAPEVYYNVRH